RADRRRDARPRRLRDRIQLSGGAEGQGADPRPAFRGALSTGHRDLCPGVRCRPCRRHTVSTLLIVGAGPRLGGAIARRFGREGYDMALISSHEASVAALGAGLRDEGITAGWTVTDVRDDAALRAAVTRFAEYTGGIDVVQHNVSTWRDTTVLDLT